MKNFQREKYSNLNSKEDRQKNKSEAVDLLLILFLLLFIFTFCDSFVLTKHGFLNVSLHLNRHELLLLEHFLF